MTLQTRVTPAGEIVARPWRGALMGNRGRLHNANGRIGAARWRGRAWIACRLQFRGRWRAPMPERGYTALFFWDEAAALAAGHRPCGECRRADLLRFAAAWEAAGLGPGRAAEIDRRLHADRLGPDRLPRRPWAEAEGLPEGTVVALPDAPWEPLLLARGRAWPWRADGGYGPARARPEGEVALLTPAATTAALAAGYRPTTRLPGSAG